MLQDCFDHADWDMFRVASDNNINTYTDTVNELIRKCIGDVVPTVTIKTYPNQKLWIDGNICSKMKARTTVFNQGKRTENMEEYKQCRYCLCKAFKHTKHQYRDKVELQFNSSDTRRMWQTITDYKRKTSHVMDTAVSLPDKLNTIFAIKDCGLSFSVADVSKTFQRVNPRKAAGPVVSLVHRACTDQLAGVFKDILNLSLSQSVVHTCFKRATIVPVPKKAKVM